LERGGWGGALENEVVQRPHFPEAFFSASRIHFCILRRMKRAGHVARMGRRGKPEERRPLGRPRRRWLDNIRMDLVEVGWGDVDWIGLAQDRDKWRALVNAVLNLRVP
jgi:hypothetical protein